MKENQLKIYYFLLGLKINLSTQKKISPPIKFATIVGIIGELPMPNKYSMIAKIGVDNCHLIRYSKYCLISYMIIIYPLKNYNI